MYLTAEQLRIPRYFSWQPSIYQWLQCPGDRYISALTFGFVGKYPFAFNMPSNGLAHSKRRVTRSVRAKADFNDPDFIPKIA